MKRSGEFDWIARHFAPLTGEGSFGLRDDAAFIHGHDAAITHDTILEGIHFLPDDPLDTVALKALRVNISDLAAKGAVPTGYLLGLGVPDRWSDDDVATFANGLDPANLPKGLRLLGGDTYRSPERLCVSVTMLGDVPIEDYRSRLDAKAGEKLVVSGTIGDAALGLLIATGQLDAGEAEAHFIQAYRTPPDQAALASLVREFASAAMDVSDGLLGDCAKLCKASGVAAQIEQSVIPLSGPTVNTLAANDDLWLRILGGGDDYQVLMSVPENQISPLKLAADNLGVQLTEIGDIVAGEAGKVSLTRDGVPVSAPIESFSHF